MKYAHIAAKVFNRPVLAAPRYLEQVGHVLLARMRGVHLDVHLQEGVPTRERTAEGALVIGDTAQLEIYGSLTRRPMGLAAISGPSLSDYDGIMSAMETLARDNRVQTIDMIYDTHGGEDDGLFEAARVIRDVTNEKQVNAWMYDRALSAGYLLASAANDVYISPEGDAGSVGVWMLHLDISQALENEGIRPTLFYAGEHKIDGHPFAALPDSVRADMQAEVDAVHTDFINAVAQYRSIDAADVRATEARSYRGQAAVDIGLADAVATPRFPAPTQETTVVSFKNPNAGSDTDSGANDAALQAATQAAHADGVAEGRKAGATDERARWAAALEGIQAHQLDVALEALGKSDMDADTIKALTGKIPAPAQQQSGSQFNAMMDSEKNPDLDAGGDESEEDEFERNVKRMVALGSTGRFSA